jgi:SAM-dependent methyltransferase
LRLALADSFTPVCPRCRAEGRPGAPLGLTGDRPNDAPVRHGRLLCPATECGAVYPIIDGLAVLVPDLDRYLGDAAVYLLTRDDLPAETMDLIGAHLPANSFFDAARQHLSSYARDHYGAWDPEDASATPLPGSSWRLVEAGLARAGAVEGPVVELGCAAGGGCFRIAEQLGLPVLGLDLSAPLIRLAQQVSERGSVRYPCRMAGTAYRDRAFPLPFAKRELVDFWLADALTPPLAAGSAGLVIAVNLVDCVQDPGRLIATVADLLRPGGKAILATPFDWSVAATPRERWLGGRSAGEPPPSLVAALAGEARLSMLAHESDLPWAIRLHERATMNYRVELILAERPVG